MNEKCVFCDAAVTAWKGCYICHKCKTVCFSREIGMNVIKQEIDKYLSAVQEWIETNNEQLTIMTQKVLNGDKLSFEEDQKYKTLEFFASIRRSLLSYFNNNINVSDEWVCQELYDLLLISDEIKAIAGI